MILSELINNFRNVTSSIFKNIKLGGAFKPYFWLPRDGKLQNADIRDLEKIAPNLNIAPNSW